MKKKLIGITGRRGSGRKTAAWLLAKTIEEFRKGTPYEKYKAKFECWVKLVIFDPSEASSTDHVVLDSFGEHILDQIKTFCPALVNFDLHDKQFCHEVVINLSTWETQALGTPECVVTEEDLITAGTNFELVREEGYVRDDRWMRLEEFIMYIAHYIMKAFMGQNVWLNMAARTAEATGSDDVRIYWDCKTQSELSYIDKNNGLIIELCNADREQDGSYRDIKFLDPDVVIDTTPGLHTCAEKFWSTIKSIY